VTRHLLLASDGSSGARGAARMAARLVRERGWTAETVGIVEPHPLYGMGPGFAAHAITDLDPALEERRREELLGRLRAAADDAGLPSGMPVRVEFGLPAPAILREAERIGAGLVVLGLRSHGPVERWFRGETAARVVQLADRPVLAVPADTTSLPSSVVVAADFSEFSLEAARLTPSFCAPDAAVRLVHVGWKPGTTDDRVEDWARTYEAGARARLEELSAELRAAGCGSVTPELRQGEPAVEILAAAAAADADLVVLGSHGHGFFDRLVLGSVSTRVLRRVPGAVLVVRHPS
jgi:nucleotide-binding universal stress UspA family protein